MKCIPTIDIRRPIRTALAVLAIAAVPAGAVAVPAFAGPSKASAVTTAAACATGWGSLPEASTFQGLGHLTDVRTGQHACFDRIVFDIDGKPSWFRVEYVKDIFTVGEGKLVPVRGGAKLAIVLLAQSYDETNHYTYNPANYDELTDVAGYRTFRQVVSAGSFEGETTIGLGVRARLPFRVFTLTGPGTTSRVVVDVAHSW
ncbi:hypothetical protein EV137_7798 [Kribbella pratensis]|uniref:AMIN-like domain-containing protein n=1 Tax=Kribbella pratensis TaxID=2512112 RepID=A0ABY2F5W2_9ACTN|nr:hypothetical protein [Kribbella pratensis]TDW81788.1 hypothetical protein EV137_7798 [Kribbella pratensis]